MTAEQARGSIVTLASPEPADVPNFGERLDVPNGVTRLMAAPFRVAIRFLPSPITFWCIFEKCR